MGGGTGGLPTRGEGGSFLDFFRRKEGAGEAVNLVRGGKFED